MKLSIAILKSRLAIFLALPILFISFGSNAAVPVIADTPCDPLYYESLSARAWLEAEREITQNQNIILKPDSVFEYTCFDRLVRVLAVEAVNMLSETPLYGAPLTNTSMDEALEAVIGVSLLTYINNNFGGKTVGTHGVPREDDYNLLYGHVAGTGINHYPKGILDDSAYACNIMSRVWNAAKCINFISHPDHDGFYTFANYATETDDNRHLPYINLPGGGCTSIEDNWSDNLATALTSGPWTHDPVQTYFVITDAQDCGAGACRCVDADGNNSEPIPTGVTIYRANPLPAEYEEHICLQPGCRYNPPNGQIGASKEAEGCYGR